jgi:hypothetical protein
MQIKRIGSSLVKFCKLGDIPHIQQFLAKFGNKNVPGVFLGFEKLSP